VNVKELISKLENYNPELQVVVSGYEDGFEDFFLKVLPLKHEPEKPYYSGEFQESVDRTSSQEMLCFIREIRNL